MTTRQEAIECAYEATKDRLRGMSLAEFTRALDTADIHPVTLGNQCVGAVVQFGNELHACVLSFAKGRWFKRDHFALVRTVLNDHGEVVTSATTPEGERFVRRLGFKQEGEKWVLRAH